MKSDIDTIRSIYMYTEQFPTNTQSIQQIIEETIGSIGPSDGESMIRVHRPHLHKYRKSADADVDAARMDKLIGKIRGRLETGQELLGKVDAKQDKNPMDMSGIRDEIEGEKQTGIAGRAIDRLQKIQNKLRMKVGSGGRSLNRKELESLDRLHRASDKVSNIHLYGIEARDKGFGDELERD